MKLAEEFNVAVYLTNQVVSDPGGAMTFVQDPKVECFLQQNNEQCATRIVATSSREIFFFNVFLFVCVCVCVYFL